MTKLDSKINEIKKKNQSLKIKSKSNVIELIPANITQDNIKLISKWRKENWQGFITKFRVTHKGTRFWLENIWNDSERILFMIVVNNKKIGHIGIYNYDKKNKSIEIDSVLRGEKANSEIMKKVLKKLFNWIFTELNLESIQLEVFSDNFKAINLYERAGMLTVYSTPIKKIKTAEGWKWENTKDGSESVQRYLNRMKITKID